MAAYLGAVVLGIVTSLILALAFVSAKMSISKDSSWRTFAADLILGVMATIVGGLLTTLTLPALVIGILLTLIAAVVDAFILAFAYESEVRYG